MDLGEYRLVPSIVPATAMAEMCTGCAFHQPNSKSGVLCRLDYLRVEKTCRSWLVYYNNPNRLIIENIYIENTDEAYAKYCADKLKWTLNITE
jgi:hypothetical protein